MPGPSVTPLARSNVDITLGEHGYLVVPDSLRKSDITAFSPAVRTQDPRYSDFSLQQSWVMKSWHHGRGALEWEDPFSFYDSRAVDTRIRNQAILTPLQTQTLKTGSVSLAANPIKFYLSTTSANLFVIAGGASRDAYQWNNGTTLWNAETSGLTVDPTDITDFLGDLWEAQNTANNVRRKTGGVWGDGGFAAVYFAQLGNVLYWSGVNVNELFFAVASPATAANRNGPIYVGDNNTQIRALAIGDNRLYIGKDDALYVLQEGRVFKLIDFSFARDPNNFKNMKFWQGALYFPILNGLYRLVGGATLQSIGPNRGAAGEVELVNIAIEREQRTYKSLASGRVGQVVDLIPTENFLYCVIDGVAGTSQILAYNGVGWHNIVEGAATNTRIQAAYFTSALTSSGTLSAPRLWYGYGNDAYQIILPQNTDDPYEYTSETYVTTGNIDSPWFDAGLADVFKEWQEVICVSENLSSTETVQVAFEVDDIGTFQNLVDTNDAAYAFTFSPYQRLVFPRRTISKRLRLRITLNRGGTTTKTPKVKYIIVKYMVRPDAKYVWQMAIRTGYKMRNSFLNLAENTDPVEVRHRLERARDSRFRLAFDDGELEPGITNLVINAEPRPGTAGLATNWNLVSTPTATLNLIHKIHGLRSQQIVTGTTLSQGVETDTITVVAGTRYTASVYLYLSAGDAVTFGIWDTAGAAFLVSARQAATTSDFVRLEVTTTPSVTSVRLRVVRLAADATAATTFRISAAQLEITPDYWFATRELYATSWVSGEQNRCRWTDAPHASTATRPASYQAYVTNIGSSIIKMPSIMDRVRGRGAETRIVLSIAEVTS